MQEFHERAFAQHAQGPGSSLQDHKNVFFLKEEEEKERKKRKEKVKSEEQQQTHY